MTERSESGAPIHRHIEAHESEPVTAAHPHLEAIEEHVEAHLGPIDTVYHEVVSDHVHLDVLVVPAREERPCHTLVTCGMSAKPMTVPDGADDRRYAELVVSLPPTWPLDEEAWRDERHYWPVRLIKELARLPHVHATFLNHGHTVPNGDPPGPYAPGTRLCCALIAPALMAPEEFWSLQLPDGPVNFHGVVALHRDEMELKLKRGMNALADFLDEADVSELVEADRPSALPRRKRFGLF